MADRVQGRYYYAELLWKMENWAECGPAFDKVVELDSKGEFTEDAAYASVLCYNKQYQQQFSARREGDCASDETARQQEGQEGREPSRTRARP